MKNQAIRAFFKRNWWRVGAAFLLCGLLLYTIYHIFGSSSANLLTTPARDITDYKHFFGTGYLFRNEEVLTVESAGLVDPQVQNTTKVSRGVAVAKVYPTDGDLAAKQQRLTVINRQIALLEASELLPGTSLSKAAEYRKTAERIYLSLRRQVSAGFYLGISGASDEFFIECNKIASLLESGSSAKELLDGYRAEKDALLSGTPIEVIPDGFSGYYYSASEVDGYESSFTMQSLENITLVSLEALASVGARQESGTISGKIVYDYLWYLAIPIDEAAAELLAVGESCTIRFSSNGGKELNVICERILPGDGGKILLVVSCGESPEDFLFFRSQPVELLIENASGYYVPESALRTVKGDVGVYVFEGGTVYFRKVEILYQGDGYVIVARHEDMGKGYLAANDLMVTSGRNLYDGKVYR